MIGTIIDYNNAKLLLLGYINNAYGLTERVVRKTEEGERVFPAEYCGNGEFKSVADFDLKYGLSYWRIRSSPTVSPSDRESLVGAQRMVTFNYPVTLVVSIPNQKTSVDDKYTFERIAVAIAKNLNENNSSLKSQIQARRVEINMSSFNNKHDEVWREEFSGIDFKYDYRYTLMSIDFDIVVEINQNCLEDECSYYGVTTCDIINRLVSAQQRRECILPQFDFADEDDFNALSAQQIVDLTTELCGGDCGGTINVYVDGVLFDTIVVADFNSETINIDY